LEASEIQCGIKIKDGENGMAALLNVKPKGRSYLRILELY